MHTEILDKLQRIKKPWFTDDCKKAMKPGKAQKDSSTTNVGYFKQFLHCSGIIPQNYKSKQAKVLENYISNLNMPAPILKVRNTIRKIKVTGTAEKYNHIKLGKHFYRQKGNIQIHYQILKSPKQEQRMSSANLQ